MKRVILLGCGGHARSVASTLVDNDPNVQIIFIDDNAGEDEYILGFPVVRCFDPAGEHLHVAIGDNLEREKLSSGNETVRVISNRAIIQTEAEIGAGSFVGVLAYVGPRASIGKGCIINTACVVEHDSRVGDFSHISVHTTVAGYCVIGRRCFVGAGAVIRDHVSIGDDVIVGAGAVVVSDIAEPGVYTGCPAKRF